MEFNVLTLFPEMINDALNHSILKRASEKNIISINTIDIRDFAGNKHRKVDDYPYGGGAGMLMQPEPVYNAYMSINEEKRKKARVIYMSPQGRTFDQKIAADLSKEDNIIILCGHYEGIDERVLEEIVTDEISIGNYVLTGGELAACVIIDAVSRLISGVLNKDESYETETFSDNLAEYPQYTRPFEFMGKKVPDVLLSGNHELIEKWRRHKSVERTLYKRPELLKNAVLSQEERRYVRKTKDEKMRGIIDKLYDTHFFSKADVLYLLENRTFEIQEYISKKALEAKQNIFGEKIYTQCLVEISNKCKNDCYFCAINKNSREVKRYRLKEEEILGCVIRGEKLGFKEFMLQCRYDSYFTDDVLIEIIKKIKNNNQNNKIMLYAGERSYESCQKLFNAGADGFLLCGDAVSEIQHKSLHTDKAAFEKRMQCFINLKDIGYKTGCSLMTGLPYQTNENIASGLEFIRDFSPQMVNIEPFVSYGDTDFDDIKNESIELSLFLISFIRILQPEVLLYASATLDILNENGRKKAILSGANAVMEKNV